MSKLFYTVDRKTLLIVGFIFLLSFVLIGTSFWFKGSMREAYNLIDHANQVEAALRDILFRIKDAESDMRGYVITDRESYYDSFLSNKSYVDQKLGNLMTIVKDSRQMDNCITLNGLLEERFSILHRLVKLPDTLYVAEFQQLVHRGEIVMQKVEDHVASMVEYEEAILAEHEHRLFSLMNLRLWVSILGSSLAMVLGLIIFRMIRQESAFIQKRQDLLQELNSNKDKFFSIISHDLKNPFTAMKGFIEMLNHQEYREREGAFAEIAERLKSSSERFERLLDDLLTWARLQMNAVSVRQEKIKLNELLYEIAEHYRLPAEAKNVSLEIKTTAECYALADKAMTETIVRNLISNAVKFTEKGSISLTTYQTNGYVVVDVSDTGTGMDEQVLQDLFQLGKVKSQKGTRNETGTGMGLILCKDMAERQGGRLEVTSVYGEGTAIKLSLKKAGLPMSSG